MLFALLLALLIGCHSTGTTEVGVRTAKVGLLSGPGVVTDIYPSGGTYMFPPIINDWNVFDVGVQNLEMTRSATTGARAADDSLHFKTHDGNDISVDVTLTWHIEPSKVVYVLQFVGPDTRHVEERLVRPVARTVLRDVLNELRSEEYYDATLRFKKADQARDVCNYYLNPEGVVIDQILPGEHKFNPEYEAVINEKTVADQEASRLRSQTEAARAERRRDLEQAKGQVNQTIEVARGEASKLQIRADSVYFQRQRESEAMLVEARASAEGLKAQAKAMSGAGGANMVKLGVAESLKDKSILFLPTGGMDLRTTNMNKLLELYGLQAASGQSP